MNKKKNISNELSKWIGATIAMVLAGCGRGFSLNAGSTAATGSAATPTPTPDKHIFTSTAGHTGGFGGTAATALTGADTFCQNDAGNTNAGTYKALIANSLRDINQDWVLAASTQYKRLSDDAIIGTTTAGKVFTFNLTNGFAAATGNYVWTGLNADWSNRADNCNNWTDGTAGSSGGYGYGGVLNATSIRSGVGLYLCNVAFLNLICVEQ